MMTELKNETGYTPVFRIVTELTALSQSDLDHLIDRVLHSAVHISGNDNFRTMHRREDGSIWIEAEAIKVTLKRWPSGWRGYPRKTEVFYILVPLKGVLSLTEAVRFSEQFEYSAFGVDGEMGLRDCLYSLQAREDGFDMHMLVNRDNFDDLLTFHKSAKYNFEGARDLLARTAQDIGLELSVPDETNNDFTMGFRDAIANGIDYRDFDRVDRLPSGIEMVAIAGVWGDNQNLRCLFELADGLKVRRDVYFRSGYEISEIGISGKLLSVGSKYLA